MNKQELRRIAEMNVIKQFCSIPDRDNLDSDSKIYPIACLSKGCKEKTFFVIHRYGTINAVCPHCEGRHKIRFCKNGSTYVKNLEV